MCFCEEQNKFEILEVGSDLCIPLLPRTSISVGFVDKMINNSLYIFVIIILLCDHLSCIKEYESALEKSMLFYQAQRSGKLGPENKITWRKDAHVDDKGKEGEDLSGKVKCMYKKV